MKRPPATVAEPATALVAFEKRQRDKAEALARDERWSDAADHWHVLALVQPDVPELCPSERRGTVAESPGGGRPPGCGGRSPTARQRESRRASCTLKALSADPGNSAALQALREIEKERASRGNTVKPGHAIATMPRQQRGAGPAAAPPPYPAERRDLDYGVMLYHQGEYASSIRTLETYLKTTPRTSLAAVTWPRPASSSDSSALRRKEGGGPRHVRQGQRRRPAGGGEGVRGSAASLRKSLADEHYEQGLRAYNSDLRAAIEHWERSLKYDPSHLNASVRLRQARQVEKNLRNIGDGEPKK
ncbi:MAG: hypothetical protein MZV70_62670 [Desulfobacterales bacterium]|nr:hypothetical protein [Desulfobacterales bacterium]